MATSGTARPTIAVVDTGSGNLRSVEKALARAGATPLVTSDPDAVAAADKIVVPGQGAFGGCVAGLERGGGALKAAVLESIQGGKPYFGICLGLQVLFEGSEEDTSCRGLGVMPGKVVRFCVPPLFVSESGSGGLSPPPPLTVSGTLEGSPNPPATGSGGLSPPPPTRIKVPHMGWNACARGPAAERSAVLAGTPEGTWFYFVHSFFPVPANPADVALEAEHGVRFCAAVARDNVFATQFHPEKSQGAGLALLSRFVAC